MKTIYRHFNEIRSILTSFDLFRDQFKCYKCGQSQFLVPHDIIYTPHKEPVGQRIFCSSRCRHQGCGATIRLYAQQVIPGKHHSTTKLSAFITHLLNNETIENAYRQATGTDDTRQASRWLHKLHLNLSQFRVHLNMAPVSVGEHWRTSSRRLHLLLPTFRQLVDHFPEQDVCQSLQLLIQQALI